LRHQYVAKSVGDETMKIQEIKDILAGTPTEDELALFREDPRKGVQKLLAAYVKRQEAAKAEADRLEKLMAPERSYWEQGIEYVAGCDEAGRGPLAGPLVTAAVILPHEINLPGLNDSKQVTPKRREALYDEIREQAVAITVSILGPKEIDEMNIYQAAKYAMTQCLTHLTMPPGQALTDAMPLHILHLPVRDIVHGDSKSAAIAAASIIAKVTRDRIMVELDKKYPQYGFAGHKGYGSQLHMQAIEKYGPCKWHRRSYEPLKSMAEQHDLGIAVSENKLLQLK
jgi:ribonuclease HII